MPSREEIVEWLREAAGHIAAYSGVCDARGEYRTANALFKLCEMFDERAAQVTSMRCETCKNEFVVTGKYGEGIPCPWSGSGGCFHHEPK